MDLPPHANVTLDIVCLPRKHRCLLCTCSNCNSVTLCLSAPCSHRSHHNAHVCSGAISRSSSTTPANMRRAAHAAALLLLLAASSMAAAQSQTQSGLLYWCSTVEGGANFDTVPGAPRSFWGVNLNPWMANGACHAGGALSNDVQYTFNNGTAYPTNRNPAVNNFAISPTQCQVRGPRGCNAGILAANPWGLSTLTSPDPCRPPPP